MPPPCSALRAPNHSRFNAKVPGTVRSTASKHNAAAAAAGTAFANRPSKVT